MGAGSFQAPPLTRPSTHPRPARPSEARGGAYSNFQSMKRKQNLYPQTSNAMPWLAGGGGEADDTHTHGSSSPGSSFTSLFKHLPPFYSFLFCVHTHTRSATPRRNDEGCQLRGGATSGGILQLLPSLGRDWMIRPTALHLFRLLFANEDDFSLVIGLPGI